MIKKLLKLFWRAGVDEVKPPMRQLMTEDEFSKRSLIGDEGDYDDMLVDENGHKRPKKYFKSKTVSLELLMEDIIPYAINCNHLR